MTAARRPPSSDPGMGARTDGFFGGDADGASPSEAGARLPSGAALLHVAEQQFQLLDIAVELFRDVISGCAN